MWARVDIASRASKKAPLGLFCPPDCTAGRCCSNPPAFVSFTHTQNKKLQRSSYVEAFLVGAGGFEPPKLKAADLQSVPIGHSGTRPDSIFTATADCLYILPSRLDFVNRFLKKISIKVQLFRKTLRLHGFCFLLSAPFL